MAFGCNITRCVGNREPCLGRNDCCYECQYSSWCLDRCRDRACRMDRVRDRLHIEAKEKAHDIAGQIKRSR